MNELNYEKSGSIASVLSSLLERSNALTALLVTKEGISIAHAGDISYLNATAMAALVAGMFSATREVARMVGEKQFSMLLQQGENRHIHISLINEAVMMVLIFDDYQRIGLVRHEARSAGKILAELLSRDGREERTPADLVTSQFKEYALNLIDQIFDIK